MVNACPGEKQRGRGLGVSGEGLRGCRVEHQRRHPESGSEHRAHRGQVAGGGTGIQEAEARIDGRHRSSRSM